MGQRNAVYGKGRNIPVTSIDNGKSVAYLTMARKVQRGERGCPKIKWGVPSLRAGGYEKGAGGG